VGGWGTGKAQGEDRKRLDGEMQERGGCQL